MTLSLESLNQAISGVSCGLMTLW